MDFERTDPGPLNLERFADPDPSLGIQIEWLWDEAVTEGRIETQLREFASKGIGEVVIEPWDGLVAGTEPGVSSGAPYLSERFLDLVGHALDVAENLGLHIWIYDGNGAGDDTGAQKLALAARPELEAWSMREIEPGEFEAGRGGFDKLDPRAAAALISVQHARIIDRFSRFTAAAGGNTLRGFWKDEPKLAPSFASFPQPGLLCWSPTLVDLFQQRFGYDLDDDEVLTSILHGKDAIDRKRRIDYFSALADLYAEAYFKPLQEWHREHGMFHLVQPLVDNAQLREQMRTMGSMFTMQKFTDVPGTDMWPGMQNDQHLSEEGGGLIHIQGASIAHMYGKSRAQGEPYGLQGWGLELAQQKALSDRIYARGINMISPAVTHFGYNNSQSIFSGDFGPMDSMWPYYGLLQEHLCRVGELLCGAVHMSEIAVLHPMTSMWGADPEDAAADAPLRNVYLNCGGAMIASFRNFDVATEEMLADGGTTLEDGTLRRHDHEFSVVILPGLSGIFPSTADLLIEFVKSGGKVVSCGPPPTWSADGEDEALREKMSELFALSGAVVVEEDLSETHSPTPEKLRPLLDALDSVHVPLVHIAGGNSISGFSAHEVYHARRGADHIFFVTNYPENAHRIPSIGGPPKARSARPILKTRIEGVPEIWDTETGNVRPAPHWWTDDATTSVQLELAPYGSALVVMRPGFPESAHVVKSQVPVVSVTHRHSDVVVAIDPPREGRFEIEVEYKGKRGAGVAEVTEIPAHRVHGPFGLEFQPYKRLPGWISIPAPENRGPGNLAEDHPGFTGTVVYTTHFETERDDFVIDLGEVLNYATVYVDDVEVGRKAWPPYRFPTTGTKSGYHSLRIEVTNTAANAEPGPDYNPKKPYGLLGPVTIHPSVKASVTIPLP